LKWNQGETAQTIIAACMANTMAWGFLREGSAALSPVRMLCNSGSWGIKHLYRRNMSRMFNIPVQLNLVSFQILRAFH
jgi:hypothetical protein